MNINRRRFVTIVAGMALAASAGPAHARPVVWQGVVLGADAKLIITGVPVYEARRLIDLVKAEVERLENIFSIYRPQSTISRLNASGALEMPPAELLSLLSTVDAIHMASNGMFDPTIQPLWKTYADHAGHPPRNIIDQKLDAVGWQHVSVSANSIVLKKNDMALTLNGIAQGLVTDRVVDLLKAHGLRNAVVKMGEISAVGRDQSGNPWDIGIAALGDGFAEEGVQLSDQSIATSSAGGTTFDGKASHIIHPRDGMPASRYWHRVSVIHKSAAVADGISTAATLMNQSQITKMLNHFTGAQLLGKRNDGTRFACRC